MATINTQPSSIGSTSNHSSSAGGSSKDDLNISHLGGIMSDAKTKAMDMVDGVSDKASDLYSQAGTLLEGNTGKIVGGVAIALAAGAVGFLIGRGMQGDLSDSIS